MDQILLVLLSVMGSAFLALGGSYLAFNNRIKKLEDHIELLENSDDNVFKISYKDISSKKTNS